MVKKTIYMFLILCICLNVVCLTFFTKKNGTQGESESQSEQFEYYGNYNLIYGDWSVVDFIEGGRNYDANILKTFIGEKITYQHNLITIGDIEYQNPNYVVYVIPMVDRMLFLGGDHYPQDEKRVFDIESAYFVAIGIRLEKYGSSDLICSLILVKDDYTLILKTDYGYCILERTAYIKNKDEKIPRI